MAWCHSDAIFDIDLVQNGRETFALLLDIYLNTAIAFMERKDGICRAYITDVVIYIRRNSCVILTPTHHEL
jgi:hypothetical protein